MAVFTRTIILAIIIFLLSSIFRVFFLDLIEFKSDEATTVYQTVQFFNHPYLISRGLISGTGMYNFPLFNYLMIIFAVWSQDPQILSWMIALINSLLVSAFFLLIKRYYDLMTAGFASLLLAFSPWGVIFSRKIWAQDLIFLLLIPFLWLLHEAILRKNSKVYLPMFILLVLLAQLHGSGLFLFIITMFVLFLLRVRLNIKHAIAGILIGLIPGLPYIFFQLSAFPVCPDCEAFLKYQNAFRSFDFNNLMRPFQIISGLGYHFILGRNYADFTALYPLINLFKYVFASGFLVTVLGMLFIIVKKQKYFFLVIYFVAIPLLYLVTKTPAYMHYFVIIIPMSILLFSIAVSSVHSLMRSRFLKTLVISSYFLFLTSNIAFLYFFNTFLDLKKDIEGDYGPVYSLTQDFVEKEISKYNNLSYYPQLKHYAYIHAQSNNFHNKLGEFLLEKGELRLAEQEFNK